MDQLFLIFDSLQITFIILGVYWWIWAPIVLFVVFYSVFELYNQFKYAATLKWVIIEIKVPQEAHKSLNAMEQIFTALHAIATPRAPKKLIDKYRKWKSQFIEGKVQDWLSLETVSISGEIHYYIRVIEKYRTLVEAQIYAHYPDSELSLVSDYLEQLPPELPTNDIDLTGVELGLIKNNAYPIKTYSEFEEEGAGKDDFKIIDPMAPLAEAMSSIGFGEYLVVQILIRSTGDKWIKESQIELDKLWERPVKAKSNIIGSILTNIENVVGSIIGGAGGVPEVKKEEKKEGKKFSELGPGLQDIIKAMEASFSKLAFETGIWVVYIAPRDRFKGSDRVRMIAAAFKQFSSQSFNGFKPSYEVDIEKGFRKEAKSQHRRPIFWRRYKSREFPHKPFVLNTEELTTVFHFPDIGVKTPALPRIEAKKGEAPHNLPIV